MYEKPHLHYQTDITVGIYGRRNPHLYSSIQQSQSVITQSVDENLYRARFLLRHFQTEYILKYKFPNPKTHIFKDQGQTTSPKLWNINTIFITRAHFLLDTHTKPQAKLFRNTKQLQEAGNPGTQNQEKAKSSHQGLVLAVQTANACNADSKN